VLTRQKLELSRLPREIPLSDNERWRLGTPKSELEPLLDFWLEKYDWRAQEAEINTRLPQFRTLIDTASLSTAQRPSSEASDTSKLRLHFVHKRSSNPNAIPLLFCHGWPGSFLDILPLIEPLSSPSSRSVSTFNGPDSAPLQAPSFHVVCPSIPGFGFSDASDSTTFGAAATATVFDALMRKLGYSTYVVHGSGWGWRVARQLALQHGASVAATHTHSPAFPEPQHGVRAAAWWKWRVARLTAARVPWLAFGYSPADVRNAAAARAAAQGAVPADLDLEAGLTAHPQTPSFALCDSPPGLLATVLDLLHAASGVLPPPVDILNKTMMHWLPGPEAALRWIGVTRTEKLYTAYSPVPLGISCFSWEQQPVLWAEGWQKVVWCRKRHESISVYAAKSGEGKRNDRDAELVVDLRDFVRQCTKEGWL